MSPNAHTKLLVCGICFVFLAACSHVIHNNSSSPGSDPRVKALTLHPDMKDIMVRGVIDQEQGLILGLATPSNAIQQPSADSRYSVRVNTSIESIPVSVNEVIKGPIHFSTLIEEQYFPVNQLTFYENGTSLYSIENEQHLPPMSEWFSLLKLEVEGGQVCLTWPDDLFVQAALLSANEQRRLQLQKQSSVSPLCVELNTTQPVEWRINLRNPMFAVQFTTNS